MTLYPYGQRPDILAGHLGNPIAPQIGWYFAGLVDGEGCFSIADDKCLFVIKLRDDDRALLESLRLYFGGIGRMYALADTSSETRVRRGQARWTVAKQRELIWLTELFDAYPLRSKKARDYAVWREAVIAHANGMPPSGLAEFKRRIREARAYVAPAAPNPDSPLPVTPGRKHRGAA